MSSIIDVSEDNLPLTHSFSEGVYAREIFMPKDMIVVGQVHKTTHLNIVSKGKAYVWMNGSKHFIEAPFTFESKAGTRKVLYIIEDMFWTTIHKTDSKDVDEITKQVIDESATNKEKTIEIINNTNIELNLLKEKGEI